MTTTTDFSSWYIDSGYTDHMTNVSNYFSIYTNISFEKRIVQRVGGIVLEVIDIGDINVQVHLGDVEEFATLTEVLFVPKLGTSLFSSQKIAQKNIDTITSKHSYRLVTQSGQIVMQGVLVNKFYKLLITPLLPSHVIAFHVGTFGVLTKKEGLQSLDIWHKQLAYVHHNMIKKMVSHNIVEGLALIGRLTPHQFYNGYTYSKNRRSSFPFNDECHKAIFTGDLVHSDICRPMSNATVSGAKYFILFKDDATDYRVVQLLTKKLDAFCCFKDFLSQFQRETQLTISRLRTDRGSEFINQTFREFLHQYNIVQELTTTYTLSKIALPSETIELSWNLFKV